MSSNDLTYFAGIAGTGMSSLALLLARRGERVMGHDDDATASLQLLRDAGIPCTAGATPELPADVTRFVRSAAVTPEHPLATAAAARGFPVARYAEAAAAVMADSYQVVVAGTHGKSTTTGLVAWMLTEAGFGPEFLVGATSEQLDGARARSRRGLFVVEGCEYDRSFLAYRPNLAVITSVEGDQASCRCQKAPSAMTARSTGSSRSAASGVRIPISASRSPASDNRFFIRIWFCRVSCPAIRAGM
jgi:UDP-N-acetylmuramate--alanine ligase